MGVPDAPEWDQQIARGLGVAPTPAVIKFIHLWSAAEGGDASNNPFNTTQPGFGETGNYNGVGVKNYATPQQGIQATIHTLKNGKYGNILQAMKRGTSAVEMAQALANSPWGTGSLVLKMLGQPTTPQPLPGAPLAQQAPVKAPIPGLPSVATGPTLQQSFDEGAPSDASVSVLSQLGGIAGKTAQAAQASIPLPTGLGSKVLGGFGSRVPVSSMLPTIAPQQAPLPKGKVKFGDPVAGGTGISSEHPTEGLAGFPARDYFAPSGSTAVAPVGGKVVRLSGHDPKQGPVEGPHGPLGWSVYIQGNDGHEYYLTHMGSRSVKVGQKVKAGQPIGTVADYAKYGTPSHIHMGVK